MTLKRRPPEEFREHLRRLSLSLDRAEELLEQQKRAVIAARQAELKGAMILGTLYQRKHPGTFTAHVYQRLSDPQRPPTEGLLKLLRLLGEA